VLAGLIRIGAEDGARDVRRLRTALLARYGAPEQFQRDHDRAAALVALSHPVYTEDAVWQYRFTADAEAKAILEAALGGLSAPWHPDGARDPRSPRQRRGQALVEVCRRVTAAAKAAGAFGGHPTADTVPADAAAARPAGEAHGEGEPTATAKLVRRRTTCRARHTAATAGRTRVTQASRRPTRDQSTAPRANPRHPIRSTVSVAGPRHPAATRRLALTRRAMTGPTSMCRVTTRTGSIRR